MSDEENTSRNENGIMPETVFADSGIDNQSCNSAETASYGDTLETNNGKPHIVEALPDGISIDGITNQKDDVIDIGISGEKSFLKKNSESQLFVIDPFPDEQEDINIPSYDKRVAEVLSKEIKDHIPDNPNNCSRSIVCFNCDGDHSLRDCLEPKDYDTINRNRKKSHVSSMRYHVDDDQRFGHLRAGQMSDALRKALGLGPVQIPMHVYRMRVLGYPPGWLEDHKITHSGLNMFDSEGNVFETPDNIEDGEIATSDHKSKYDVKKLISYPGYNEDPEPGTLDENDYYDVPPFDPMQNKSYMIERIADDAFGSYKKQKLKLQTTPEIVNAQVADMDLGEDELLQNDEVSIVCSTPKNRTLQNVTQKDKVTQVCLDESIAGSGYSTSESRTQNSSKDSRSTSPTLADLESTKKLLLAELHETNGSPVNNETENIELFNSSSLSSPLLNSSDITSDIGVKNILDNDVDSDNCVQDQSNMSLNISSLEVSSIISDNSINDTQNDHNEQTNQCENTSINGTPLRCIKSSALGTPVISYSPYSALPDANTFSKQIADVINFENLPDAVGKYNNMKGVLRKVRNTLQDMK